MPGREIATKYAALLLEFALFSESKHTSLPYVGCAALIFITLWLASLRARGFAAPRHDKYALRVFSDAIGIPFPPETPLNHTCCPRETRTPFAPIPLMPLPLIMAMEKTAAPNANPTGLRVYCALFRLMSFASLRFPDLRQVVDNWVSNSAICGLSVNQKAKNGDLTQWATPKMGIALTGFRESLALRYWGKIIPREGRMARLSPYVDKACEIDSHRKATNGAASLRY